MSAAQLLKDNLSLFEPDKGVVLDLACGRGQNGLLLKAQNIELVFADLQQQHLSTLHKDFNIDNSALWQADFESESSLDAQKLAQMQLQGILVFRYLHRPLFDSIKQAIKPGGIVIYETFTIENRQFGRPNRADFLLELGELKTVFKEWDILFYFEGIKENPDRAIAQIICQKPD
ncbi:tellurite resistance protein [uncultured Psychromonas sp.]|uniref:tellurite resistance protein n=1 Tax=uncultured Psychromonas sp. TaxID=173974 RepID=UPI002636AE10|nr:tellurite resistance protein [uncultured Psychromonas sp.]